MFKLMLLLSMDDWSCMSDVSDTHDESRLHITQLAIIL